MGDAEDKSQANLPEWQNAQEHLGAEAQTNNTNSKLATLEQARRFLQDPEVKKGKPERKAEFLASKGVSQSEIEELLKAEVPAAKVEALAPNVS